MRRAEGIETVCVSPALVFGPGEIYRRTLPLFRLVKWGLLPVVPPGGTTLCDVRDVAVAHVAALAHGEPGARYILGGPQLTFRALATTIAEVTRGARPIAELPLSWLRVAALPESPRRRGPACRCRSARETSRISGTTVITRRRARRRR